MLPHNPSEFFDKSLCINCPQITLTQKSSDSPTIYQGSGSISRNEQGKLEIKLSLGVDDQRLLLKNFIEEFNENYVGKFIPENRYFCLSATDEHDREWKSTMLRPRYATTSNNQRIVIAQLNEISHTADISSNQSDQQASLCLYVSKIIEFPFNINRLCSIVSKEEIVPSTISAVLPAAYFSACGYTFYIIKYKNNGTLIEVYSNGNDLPKFIETRVCEALQFVLGDFVLWSALEFNQRNKRTIRLRSLLDREKKTIVMPPIRFKAEFGKEDVWKLYEKYLSHIINHPESRLHPISAWIRHVMEMRISILEAEMLVVSVAVEYFLKMESFKAVYIGNNSSNIESQVSLVHDKLKELELEDSFKKRLYGFLSSIKSNPASATDILKHLTDKGLVDEKFVKAWKKCRNKTAHGYSIKPEEVESEIKLCRQVYVLFNHLIFLIIGYTGKYTDYSEEGWIEKDFNKLLERENIT
ncbi:MAG: hypothetical protein F6J89_17220 [Symploca sp. SIO1C4]|uniref:ApeA N-terminal domain-containing protein n=1 Tax=Symploca sp. SIO1C4 TaxID=2607765 RepID=A0A6B3NI33_9CYAN|nr:hypothetical protein [Symploca sp. SIO1C4]